MADYQALKTELATAPYNGLSDSAAASALNATINLSATNLESCSGGAIAATLDRTEWTALSAADRALVTAWCAGGVIPLTAEFKATVAAVFGPATATRARMLALQTQAQTTTRAIQVFGSPVTNNDVAKARSL